MSLVEALRDAEARAQALRDEIARDEADIAREHARAAQAERNIEQWWFGAGRLQRLLALARYVLRR